MPRRSERNADVEKGVCPHCSTPLDPGEGPCRHCGARAGQPSSQHPAGAAIPDLVLDRPKRPRDLAESRWTVLVLLFAALGPLALPVLWRSSRFSRAWKTVLTILVVIFTVVVVWVLWYAVKMFVASLREYDLVRAF